MESDTFFGIMKNCVENCVECRSSLSFIEYEKQYIKELNAELKDDKKNNRNDSAAKCEDIIKKTVKLLNKKIRKFNKHTCKELNGKY